VKRALICGVGGQDGAYLARLLLDKGYTVIGTSRDAQTASFSALHRLGVRDRVQAVSMTLTDFRSVLQVIADARPDEVYNLAGQTSVGLSFQMPVETLESISVGTLNLLEALRFTRLPARLYNACSSECFGDTGGVPATEQTAFRPRSPYGVAKAAAFWQVANYREAYGLFACSGILFNHESPLRPERFVTRKIVAAAARIAAGSDERLTLGNLDVVRDWGWAPEYVDAMWRMLQQDVPDDYIVATGESRSLRAFVAEAFEATGLDWQDHVATDAALLRPSDLAYSGGDPSRAAERLGWRATVRGAEVVRRMVEAEQALAGASVA
jgi:GDPmannose 4,6-dehydratase